MAGEISEAHPKLNASTTCASLMRPLTCTRGVLRALVLLVVTVTGPSAQSIDESSYGNMTHVSVPITGHGG